MQKDWLGLNKKEEPTETDTPEITNEDDSSSISRELYVTIDNLEEILAGRSTIVLKFMQESKFNFFKVEEWLKDNKFFGIKVIMHNEE